MAPRRPLTWLLLASLLAPWSAALGGELEVRFLDVGQGDAAWVRTPGGKTLLIDAGPPEATASVTRRVRSLNQGPLDLVVLTHPHLDHLAGMASVVRAVGAVRYMDSDFDHPSTAYAQLLELLGRTIKAKLPTGDPAKPDTPVRYELEDDVALTVLWPRIGPDAKPALPFLRGTRSDVNANSVVLRLSYRAQTLLLVGDAEADTERWLLEQLAWPRADVLKVAHHGSRHSSTAPFLAAVRPKVAVISCAARNDYGHPSGETLARLAEVGAQVLRTDHDGEVAVFLDGEHVRVETTRGEHARSGVDAGERAPAPPADAGLSAPPELESGQPPQAGLANAGATPEKDEIRFVASSRSGVFHRTDCRHAASISVKNRLEFSSREQAARGRTPAQDCKP